VRVSKTPVLRKFDTVAAWRGVTKIDRIDAFRTGIDLTLIFAGFAALVYMNREWLLNELSGIDQWVYTSFFLHYDIPSVYADQKKLARLPWILSGFALNRIFSPVFATQVLHGSYFLLSCTAVYIAIRQRLDRNIALLTTFFCLFCVQLYGPGGWDYHDVAGGVFYLWTYIALAFAAERQERPLLHFFGVGLLLALAVHGNIISINLFPVLVIEIVFVLKRRGFNFSQSNRWLTAALFGIVFGAVTCTVVLGLINLSFGREFLFFATLVSRSADLILDPSIQESWWLDWTSLWWANETHMALYSGVLVLALGLLANAILKRRNLWADVTNVLCVEYVVAFAIMLGWQVLGQTSLQPSYMTYPLMFPMIFALAAVIARVLGANEPRDTAISWFCAIAFALYMIFGETIERSFVEPLARNIWFLLGRDDLEALLPFLVLTCGFIAVGALAGVLRRSIVASSSAYMVLFSCVTFVLAATDRQDANSNGVRFGNDCVRKEPAYAALVESNRYLFDQVDRAHHVKLWFNPDELIGVTNCRTPVFARNVGKPLIFTGIRPIMPWSQMADGVADIPVDDLEKLNRDKDVVAVISETTGPAVELADRLTKEGGRAWGLLQSTTLTQEPIRFTISLVGDATRYEEIVSSQAYSDPLPSKIVTPPEAYGHTEIWPFSDEVKKRNVPGYVKVRLSVVQSILGVGVLSNDRGHWIDRRYYLSGPSPMREVRIFIPDLSEGGSLVFLTGNTSQSAIGLIESASVFAEIPSTVGTRASPQ
jgi:hypothetical protein